MAKILPVYLDEGGTAVLTPGEKLLLTGTDGQNTFFRTDDGRTGSIRPEYDGEGGWTINVRIIIGIHSVMVARYFCTCPQKARALYFSTSTKVAPAENAAIAAVHWQSI